MLKQISLVLSVVILLPTPALAAPSDWPLVSFYGALTILSAGVIGYGITWINRN